jgi:hypothetical protein
VAEKVFESKPDGRRKIEIPQIEMAGRYKEIYEEAREKY